MDAGLIFEAAKLGHELRREDGFDGLVQDVDAGHREHDFHLRVPALDGFVEADGEDADVDGFDDVLVEFLEPFVLGDFLGERCVEAGVLYGDADVGGQRFEQLDIFGREEVAGRGAAQADDGDGALLQPTGQVVVQIKLGGRGALRLTHVEGLAGIFKEEVRAALIALRGGPWGSDAAWFAVGIEVQEFQVERLRCRAGYGHEAAVETPGGGERVIGREGHRGRWRRGRRAACASAGRLRRRAPRRDRFRS